jgi:hypothetical protein
MAFHMRRRELLVGVIIDRTATIGDREYEWSTLCLYQLSEDLIRFDGRSAHG